MLFRSDTLKKAGDLVVHIGHVESGQFALDEPIDLALNQQKRSTLKANHSATHLLHQALRLVLGDHVSQKGSQVTPDRLRFDFAHPKALSIVELEEIEKITNQIVLQNGQVSTRLMGQDEAIEAGAMALFGEKYGDEVRVVSMGTGDGGHQTTHNSSDNPYSVELCGGTHVERTGDIGLIRIVSETAVAAGVRRIEALSGQGARGYLGDQDKRLKEVCDILKTTPTDVPDRLRALVDERKNLEKALADAKRKLAMGSSGSNGGADIRSIGKLKYLARSVEGIPPKDLRGLVDDGKQQIGSGVVAIVTVTEEGKAGLSVGVTSDLTSQYDAVDLVKTGSLILGGKGGGGRPDMAQAGGPDGSKAQAALDAIEKRIGELVGDKV